MQTAVLASKPEVAPQRVTPGLRFVQWWLGLGSALCLTLPYVRCAPGLNRLDPAQRYLFVCNHVSLLDTILLGGLFWQYRRLPFLVLGDKAVWNSSWLRRFLSRRIGYLLERGRLNPNRIAELEEFGRAGREMHLLVFPEGTRGDGLKVGPCQPGIFSIAQAAQLPIVPVFIANMQLISTKTGPFHPFAGWRKVEVNFGPALPPEDYLRLERESFTNLIREKISAAQSVG
jgi:1-acyl-sn-glycerol-3-phosphate acyltransferase